MEKKKSLHPDIRANFAFGECTAEGYIKTLPAQYLSPQASFRLVEKDVLCSMCHHEAYMHPQCGRILNADNTPFLHVLCTQERVVIKGDHDASDC